MAAKEPAKSLPVAAVVPCLARQSRPGSRWLKPWHQASLSSWQAQGAVELTHGYHGSPPRFTFAEASPSSSRDPEQMEPNLGSPGKGSCKLPTGGPQASQVLSAAGQAGKPCAALRLPLYPARARGQSGLGHVGRERSSARVLGRALCGEFCFHTGTTGTVSLEQSDRKSLKKTLPLSLHGLWVTFTQIFIIVTPAPKPRTAYSVFSLVDVQLLCFLSSPGGLVAQEYTVITENRSESFLYPLLWMQNCYIGNIKNQSEMITHNLA